MTKKKREIELEDFEPGSLDHLDMPLMTSEASFTISGSEEFIKNILKRL